MESMTSERYSTQESKIRLTQNTPPHQPDFRQQSMLTNNINSVDNTIKNVSASVHVSPTGSMRNFSPNIPSSESPLFYSQRNSQNENLRIKPVAVTCTQAFTLSPNANNRKIVQNKRLNSNTVNFFTPKKEQDIRVKFEYNQANKKPRTPGHAVTKISSLGPSNIIFDNQASTFD